MKRRIFLNHPGYTLILVPRLSQLCLLTMAKNFEVVVKMPKFKELELAEKNFIEERLPPILPLDLTANLIPDGVYWQNCCRHRWKPCDVSHYSYSWKRMFFERHLENIIELFIPGVTNPQTVLNMVPLCQDHIKRLEISQLLLPIKQPQREEENVKFNLEAEDEDDQCQMDHFDFRILLSKLRNLEELSLVYRVKQCGLNFEWKMFEMTNQDCESLANAVKSCATLKVLKLRFSQVDDKKCRVLVKSLLDHSSLRELDLSYNVIGDVGARAIGKLLTQSNLEVLNLSDNKIGSHGAQAIAHALAKNCTLVSLNLRLNHLTDEGGKAIGVALISNGSLRHLHLGGTGVTWHTAVSLSKVLPQNTLKSIVLSCNNLGRVGGKALEEGMSENSSVTKCDLCLTEIDETSLSFINRRVYGNQDSEQRKGKKSFYHQSLAAI